LEINDTVLNALRTQAQRVNNALQAIEEDRDNAGRSLKEIIEHNCSLQREPNRVSASLGASHSWARIAGGSGPRSIAKGNTSPPFTHSSSPHSPLNHSAGSTEVRNATRKSRQVTVRIHETTEKENAATKSPTQLVAHFKNTVHKATGEIVAAHKLPSGDVVLTTVSSVGRQELESNDNWTKAAFPSAQVLRRTYQAMIHGVCKRSTKLDTPQEVQATVQRLNEDNKRLHPGSVILAAKWPTNANRPAKDGREKAYSSLLVEYGTPDELNQVVQKGFIEGCKPLQGERWEKGLSLTQCFNCYGYGHWVRNCPNSTKCGHCAGPHDTRFHDATRKWEVKCAVCGGKHTAWDLKCLRRQKEKQKVLQKVLAKPALYALPVDVAGQVTPRRVTQSDAKGFKLVVSNAERKKRKAAEELSNCTQAPPRVIRKVGRPSIISAREIGQQPISMQPSQKRTPGPFPPTSSISSSSSLPPSTSSSPSLPSPLSVPSSDGRESPVTVPDTPLCSQNSEAHSTQSNEEDIL
jgi:hypothetical protein